MHRIEIQGPLMPLFYLVVVRSLTVKVSAPTGRVGAQLQFLYLCETGSCELQTHRQFLFLLFEV